MFYRFKQWSKSNLRNIVLLMLLLILNLVSLIKFENISTQDVFVDNWVDKNTKKMPDGEDGEDGNFVSKVVESNFYDLEYDKVKNIAGNYQIYSNSKGDGVSVHKPIEVALENTEKMDYGITRIFSDIYQQVPDKNVIRLLKNKKFKKLYSLIEKRQKEGISDSWESYLMGALFAYGMGVEQDFIKSKEYLLLAIAKGSVAASYELALLISNNIVKPKGDQSAVSLLKNAARAGLARAMYALGYRYAVGKELAKNLKKAEYWLQQSVNKNFTPAKVELAMIILNKYKNDFDQKRAIELINQAANEGDPVAQNKMAKLMFSGFGPSVDYLEAAKWYLVSFKAGIIDKDLKKAYESLSEFAKNEAMNRAEKWINTKK